MYCDIFMQRAITLAKKSAEYGEVPVGAVIVRDGNIIAEGFNYRENGKSAICHAEIIAIDSACKNIGSWRLYDCELYVTLEPCIMCAGAIINAHIPNVYFGCRDSNAGAFGGKIDVSLTEGLFKPAVVGGYFEKDCSTLIKDFFSVVRYNKKNKRSKLMTVSMIAAVGKNNEIGADNSLLWHISADLKFFKGVTMGKSVIMGRKTFESLPKALPGRKNIVLSKNPKYKAEGASTVTSVEEALSETETDEIFIIGGESLYNLFLDRADKLYITNVDFSSEKADAFFPEIPFCDFDSEIIGEGCENGLKYKHILYTRKETV